MTHPVYLSSKYRFGEKPGSGTKVFVRGFAKEGEGNYSLSVGQQYEIVDGEGHHYVGASVEVHGSTDDMHGEE